MKGLIAWFAQNHVAANLLMCMLIVGGINALLVVPLKTFPDLDINVITVNVPYLGAAPEEVEQGVCVRIEEEIDGLDGLDTLSSTSSEGMCTVVAELMINADPNLAVDRIKTRVDAITTFPDETEKPIISQYMIRRAVIDLAISGDTDERTLKHLGEKVRDEITALDGITQADLLYTRPYEISIEVSEASLRRFGLTFGQIAAAVRRSSLDLPGGTIKTRGGEILIRSVGQAYVGKDFEGIVVLTNKDGTRVTLDQVARVVDGFNENELFVTFDRQPAVLIRTYRVGEQDSIGISEAVREYVSEARAWLPEGIEITLWKDSSTSLRGRIDTLTRNGIGGLVLVLILLAVFLRLHVAFWVSLGVPIAFLGALMTLPLAGLSIDVISLFAFIVVLGIVVDDAIVVGENIHTHQERGEDLLRSSITGAQEVTIPVIFGVLTTVAAFFPLLVIPGPMGQVYAVIGFVVIACLLFSLIESQLVLPSHLAHGVRRPRSDKHSGDAASMSWRSRVYRRWTAFQERSSHSLERLATQRYLPGLERALRWRYITVAIGLMLLLWTAGLLGSGRMTFSFFPPIPADFISASVTMPRGTPIEVTRSAVDKIASAAQQLRLELDGAEPDPAREDDLIIQHILSATGSQGTGTRHGASGNRSADSHLGEVVIELSPSEEREHIPSESVANRWRELTGGIPEAIELSFSASRESAGEAINIQLQSQNIDHLRQASARLQAELRTHAGVRDITDSFRGGKQEIKISLSPRAESLGLTLENLARQVRQAFYGLEVQRIQRDRDDVRVMVRYPEAERRSIANLEGMWIRTPDGTEVPFSSVARMEIGRGFASIRRADRQRVINVTADIEQDTANANEIIAALRGGPLPEILADYPGMSYTLRGEQREQERSLAGLARAYTVALLAIYALLAIPLRSYLQPLVIMSVIPFGIVGAIGGHLLMRQDLSFMSIIGIVALSGVVVNSSLVLVDFINRRTRQGAQFVEAVCEAGVSRFRPILLTSMTTFAGLTPLMAERSVQAQYLIPMAISIAFGVAFATLITLFLVPCSLMIIEDLRHALARVWWGSANRVPSPQLSSREFDPGDPGR